MLSAADICGIPEYRFTLDTVLLVALATELARLLEVPFDEEVLRRPVPGVMTSDEAGELPEVSTLPAAGLSTVRMLEVVESCIC